MTVKGQVQKTARRLLAYPSIRRVAVGVGRRAPGLKELGRSVVGTQAGTSSKKRRFKRPAIDIRGGHMLLEHQGQYWPIVVFVALDLEPGDTELVADAVERAQLTSGQFKPLFLVDSGQLGPFRSRSYAVETVMPRAMYARVNPQDSYGDYLAERTSSIVTAYGARSVVPLSIASVRAGIAPDELRLVGQLGM